MSVAMPVTIIGGYLGSGKTTLVNHLLRHASGVRLAVLVNDFGELPIDAELIESQDGNVISLSGGCVCCSYGDDLSSALINLQSSGEQPDHIFIEASGVALPGAIGKTLSLQRAYQLNGIVVLADTSCVIQHAKEKYIGDTIERQLLDADLIVLNKLDLISAAQIESVRQWMSVHYSHAPLIEATHSQLEPDVFFQVRRDRVSANQADATHVKCDLTEGERVIGERMTPTHDVSIFTTFELDMGRQVDAQLVAAELADKNNSLIRAKGFVLDVDGKMKTIQTVGRRWSITDAPEHAQAGLVCIGMSGKVSETVIASKCSLLERAEVSTIKAE